MDGNFQKKYLAEKKPHENIKAVLSTETNISELDELDKNILKQLSENSRTPLTELSRKTKTPFSTIRTRVKNLEKKKIISGYSLLLDVEKLNYHNYKLFVKTKNNSKKTADSIYSFANINENITYLMKTLGEYNYELRIEVETQEKYQDILKEIRSKFSESIEKLETNIVFKELKEDFSIALHKN